MLKPLFVLAMVVSVTACTLHPVTDKQKACEQAKRDAVYANTSNSPAVSQNATIQKNISANCG